MGFDLAGYSGSDRSEQYFYFNWTAWHDVLRQAFEHG